MMASGVDQYADLDARIAEILQEIEHNGEAEVGTLLRELDELRRREAELARQEALLTHNPEILIG